MIISLIVNEIVEELDVACEPLEAVSCLENCLARGNGKIDPVFVPGVKAYFRVKIGPATTFADEETELERRVVASMPVRWKPDAGGLLPRFDGSLYIHATSATVSKCVAIVRGTFTSTPGKSGKKLDLAFSARVARETAQYFLQLFRSSCEVNGTLTSAPEG